MISIGHIAHATASDGPVVAVIIPVAYLCRRAPPGRAPHNAQPRGVPGQVLRPEIAARVAERDNRLGLWSTAFKAIATPFVTGAAGRRHVVCLIRAARRWGEPRGEGEAHALPACLGVAILTAATRAFAHQTSRCRGHRHDGLTGCGHRVQDD